MRAITAVGTQSDWRFHVNEPTTLREAMDRAEAAQAAITGTMLAHMPVVEAKAVVDLKAAVQELAALALPDAPPSIKTCAFCGLAATPPPAVCNDAQTTCICEACIRQFYSFMCKPDAVPTLTAEEWHDVAELIEREMERFSGASKGGWADTFKKCRALADAAKERG